MFTTTKHPAPTAADCRQFCREALQQAGYTKALSAPMRMVALQTADEVYEGLVEECFGRRAVSSQPARRHRPGLLRGRGAWDQRA